MPQLITDEVALLASLVPLEGARILELGCGRADFARALALRMPVASVCAHEVDEVQHRKNLEAAPVANLTFALGGAQEIALPSASVDGVVMMKSLHHVPVESMDRALAEIARVLKPGGWLYASEPVYDGEFNELVKLFHDEGEVRAHAYAALGRADQGRVLRQEREIDFMAPVAFRDFDDFDAKLIKATHSHHQLTPEKYAEVRARFESHNTAQGVKFIRPMRVNLMRKH